MLFATTHYFFALRLVFINGRDGAYIWCKEVRTIKKNVTFLLKGAAIMTVFSLIGKSIGVFLRLFLSARIGSEGMGLYQLIMSVYTMFSTFATAGFTVSVSRLVAEKDVRSHSDARLLLKSSFIASVALSAFFTLAMIFGSNYIARAFLADERCGLPLRILALSMPFMALAACLKGWFIAHGRVSVTSSASLLEQLIKLGVIYLFLSVIMSRTNDIGVLCSGIVIGVTVSEVCSFLCLLLCRYFPRDPSAKSLPTSTETPADSMRSLLKVTAPISLSVWLTSLLHTAETLLIPFVFEHYSGDRGSALSSFGMIRGMVVPLLFFPFAFLSAMVSVFTPEISRLNMLPSKAERNSRISTMMSFSVMFSIAVGGLFFFLSQELGEAFYPGENTGYAIKLLAVVTPFMYIETISDGLLKAIGEQTQTLKFTVYNSVLRVTFILLFVTKSGENGYLWLLVISNTFTFLLCYLRLKKVTDIQLRLFADWGLGLLYASLAGLGARLFSQSVPFAGNTLAAMATAVYIGLFTTQLLVLSFPRVRNTLSRMRAAESV